jgi:hypothetical protein
MRQQSYMEMEQVLCNKIVEGKRKLSNWTVDSGATVHCIGDNSLFCHVYKNHPVINLIVADDRRVRVQMVGAVRIGLVDTKGSTREIIIHNVCYHPDFGDNLLSVRRLREQNGLKCVFDDDNYFECKTAGTRFPFKFKHKYLLRACYAALKAATYDVLHSRFGHCSSRRLKRLSTRCKNFPHHDVTNFFEHDPRDCDACQAGGGRRKPFPKRSKRSFTYFGERLHSDLCGPFPKSIDGYQYAMCIVDACMHFLWVSLLKSKHSSGVEQAMRDFLHKFAHKLTHGRKITWYTDNGGEFMSHDLQEFCHEFAINRGYSVPYAPPQNGKAERMWGILLRTTRTTLAESALPDKFWSYAIMHACDLHNVLPSSALKNEISPKEALEGSPPDVSRFRVWGCVAWYVLEPHERRSKVSPRAVPSIHLGMDPERNGYFVFVPYMNRITTAYHLTFQETKFMEITGDGTPVLPSPPSPITAPKGIIRQYREKRDRGSVPDHNPNDAEEQEREDGENDDDAEVQGDKDQHSEHEHEDDRCSDKYCTKPKHPYTELHSYEEGIAPRGTGRNIPRENRNNAPCYASQLRKIMDKYGSEISECPNSFYLVLEDYVHQVMEVSLDDVLGKIPVPTSFKAATESKQSTRWWDAMKKEITDLLANKTWEPVARCDVPAGHKIVKSRWVYALKYLRDGSIERFKARFVVRGFSQVKGVDYYHSFSATLRSTSFRILMSMAAGEKLRLEHFDVTNAFTEAEIDSLIFIEPPDGFYKEKMKDGKPPVLKLKRALYGTKQASRLWQLELRKYLISMGFTNSTHDPCLFSKRDNTGGVMLLGVYVDDIIFAHNDEKLLEWFKTEFSKRFRAKHLGKLNWFLGMGIDQDPTDYSITISQQTYIKKLLEKFVPGYVANAIKHSMPCNITTFDSLRPATTNEEREAADNLPYLQLIGSLLYNSTMVHPEISYHMSVLCSCMHDPTPECHEAAISLLQYIGHTSDNVLHFTGKTTVPDGIDTSLRPSIKKNAGFVAYSDASWHKTDELGRNMFGYVVYLYGGPISFCSKRMNVVARSSAEAEYAAAAATCQEIMFVRYVLADLGLTINGPVVLCVDNQAAIKIAQNIGVTKHTKHFADAIHFFRHQCEHGVITPTYVNTAFQRADGFTKLLEKGKFKTWIKSLVYPADPPKIASCYFVA